MRTQYGPIALGNPEFIFGPAKMSWWMYPFHPHKSDREAIIEYSKDYELAFGRCYSVLVSCGTQVIRVWSPQHINPVDALAKYIKSQEIHTQLPRRDRIVSHWEECRSALLSRSGVRSTQYLVGWRHAEKPWSLTGMHSASTVAEALREGIFADSMSQIGRAFDGS